MADSGAGPSLRRVLLTADPVGGVWDYALELARELDRLRVSTVLALMGGRRSEAQRRASEAIAGLTVEEGPFKLEWMPDPNADLAAAGRWLLSLEEKHRPDVIHLNNYAHVTLPWRAPRLLVAHSCVVSWWRAVRRSPLPAHLSGYAEMVATGLRAAEAVVAPSRSHLVALETIYGPLPHARVVHNGRRAADFPPLDKAPFAVTAGRAWDDAKNIRTVDEIAADLPWPVYLAGDCAGPDGTGWRPRHLIELGRLPTPELARWLGRAAVFVLPARYEPFGLTVLEAALAGCALIVGDTPTIRELWNGAALFVPPDDPVRLTAALRLLLERPHRCAALGAAARARALAYDPTAMARAYHALYEEIAAGRRPGAGRTVETVVVPVA